jgi:hypothetical protein
MPTLANDESSIDVGRAVEIVGPVGIILSLIFPGYDLKRSNDIADAETSGGASDSSAA